MTQSLRRPSLFAGEWRGASDDGWLDILNPADQRHVVGMVPALSGKDIRETYDAAEAGKRVWAGTDPISRGAVLLAAAGLLRERRESIAADLVAEMGKTSAEATVEVAKAADFFEYYGGLARGPAGYGLHDTRPGTIAGVRFEPVGIVLAITPWNDPILTPARKIAPALLAGNAVILKPATETPLVGLHLAHALLDAGLPPTVMSVVTGRGRDISAALLDDPRLCAVTFTGSNEVGRDIMTALARRVARVQTEMGGKNASAVLADADLDLAADTVTMAAFAQAGQRCTATSRLVVDRRVSADLLDRIRARAEAITVGPGGDPATTMGPVVNRSQQEFVLAHVAWAAEEGCSLLTGGRVPVGDAVAHGCFMEPTIVADVGAAARVWQEEVFGPLLAVREVDGLDEACEAVNDSKFGLSAAVFTRDLSAAQTFIDRVDVGQVAVNLPTSGWDVHQPFGGFRASGSAFKEQGLEAMHFYSRAKTFAVRYA